ncbi:MAG TPA: hypothetical protein VE987_20640 [Polyangiaceae bacterium]|nr:hypothetical protein [Polyangiaceae bacterium]
MKRVRRTRKLRAAAPTGARSAAVAGAASLSVFLLTSAASAQTAPDAATEEAHWSLGPAPTPSPLAEGTMSLGGHQFLVPASFPTSFVATFFSIRLRAALHESPDLPTEAGSFSPSNLGVGPRLDASFKITDWAGVFAILRMSAVVGSNLPGLVYTGESFNGTAAAGVIFRLLRLDATGTQASLRLNGSYANGMSLSVFPLLTQAVVPTVRTVLQGQLGDLIRTPFNEWEAVGDLTLAQALTPFFSLQAFVGEGVSGAQIQPFDVRQGRLTESATNGFFHTGVGFEADASPARIPIAGLLEYTVGQEPSVVELLPQTSNPWIHGISLGVYYSGARDLQLGLIGGLQLGYGGLTSAVGTSGAPFTEFGELVLMHIW